MLAEECISKLEDKRLSESKSKEQRETRKKKKTEKASAKYEISLSNIPLMEVPEREEKHEKNTWKNNDKTSHIWWKNIKLYSPEIQRTPNRMNSKWYTNSTSQ